MGFKFIEVESDASQLVEAIQDGKFSEGNRVLSGKLKEVFQRTWSLEVRHIYREANRCVDQLPRICMKQQQRETIWVQHPRVVVKLLQEFHEELWCSCLI